MKSVASVELARAVAVASNLASARNWSRVESRIAKGRW
jgi:hypothetical protein